MVPPSPAVDAWASVLVSKALWTTWPKLVSGSHATIVPSGSSSAESSASASAVVSSPSATNAVATGSARKKLRMM